MEAVVQFDYTAQEPDELTLKKGDVVTDVKPMPDGWMEGFKDGKKGMFPDNYVKIVHTSSGVVLRKKNPRKCKVLFSYKPANRDELELNIDDVIEVFGEVEEGWWKGQLKNQTGVFPSNYVTEISDSKIVTRSDSKTSTTSIKKEDSIKKEKPLEPVKSTENSELVNVELMNVPNLPPKPAKEVCVALFPYEAVNSDELTLAEGDLITIISRDVEDKGWWKGELKGKVGVFPDNFVQIVNHDEVSSKLEKSSSSPRSGTTASLRKLMQSQMEKTLAPIVNKKPALPPPPPTSKKPPTAKSSSTSSISKTISGIKSMLSAEQNSDKLKQTATDHNENKQYGSIAVKRSESVGSMKKTADTPDGSCMSRSSYSVSSASVPESPSSLVISNHENSGGESKSPDFDQIERTAMLSHPTASRAKAPRRRPPSAAFSLPSEDDPSLDPLPVNGMPGVEKEKAPWVQELKMNQAKKSSSTNSVIGGSRTRVMINPSTTTITSESSDTTLVTPKTGLTAVGIGGVVFKPPGYVPPLTTPEPVTVSTPSSPITLAPAEPNPATPSVERSLIAVLNEKVKQLESTVQQQNHLVDKLSVKLEVEIEKRIQIEKEMKKIMELVTRV
ncbi:SH3 domain-containing kinase-binding protein 1 [Adelges cooleyi]|uniref:SH3 domain-containing kinase-binding protein 1 n=1 Tax=Adelges cooleyi TaxID=133065 RepID=UPI00217F4AB6|nr:SH3 domain-containing kinase-binding protein 1 [Adelges cooleyi]